MAAQPILQPSLPPHEPWTAVTSPPRWTRPRPLLSVAPTPSPPGAPLPLPARLAQRIAKGAGRRVLAPAIRMFARSLEVDGL
jgi:hypothetical protein